MQFCLPSVEFSEQIWPLTSVQLQPEFIMGAHEALEHAEHTGHAHGSKQMGVTMAILAVLIAFCAAMVGSQRQELMTALLDQSWAHSSWVAAVVKDEMAVADMQKMRGQPNAAGNPAVGRLIRMDADYNTEADLAKTWDDASDPLVDAHFDAAEGYEHAQLVAEVALIIASIAILLNNRTAWFGSLVVGAVALGLVGFTFVTARGEIAKAHHKVSEAEEDYIDHSESDLDTKGRESLLNELDPGGKIRASVAAEAKQDEEESANKSIPNRETRSRHRTRNTGKLKPKRGTEKPKAEPSKAEEKEEE